VFFPVGGSSGFGCGRDIGLAVHEVVLKATTTHFKYTNPRGKYFRANFHNLRNAWLLKESPLHENISLLFYYLPPPPGIIKVSTKTEVGRAR